MDDFRRAAIGVFAVLIAVTGQSQEVAPQVPQAPAQSVPAQPQVDTLQNITPDVVEGPEGSNLAAIRQVPSFASPWAEYLGLASRRSNDAQLERYYRSASRRRLVKTPEMFGDFLRFPTIGLVDEGGNSVVGTIPQAGGVSGLKIAENNQAITADRAWYSYNHMHDAFQTLQNNGVSKSYSSDRFMIGVERTFDDGRWSLEARLPLSGQINETNIESGSIGDLSLIFKRLLIANRCQAKSFGLGIELPTGDSGTLRIQGTELDLDSDAVHLIPFYASTRRYGTRGFSHLFTQLDIPTSKDDFSVGQNGVIDDTSEVRAAITASFDLGFGYWILPPMHTGDSGLAAIIEAHYTTRLGNADPERLTFNANRANIDQTIDDVLNLTIGMHAELDGQWGVRVAESIPLTDDQLFDSEAIIQVIRTF